MRSRRPIKAACLPPENTASDGQRGLERLIPAAGQRHGEEIHQRALGLMGHLRRQVVPPRVDDEFCQNLGNARIVQHAPTLAKYRQASAGRAKSATPSGD